MTAVAALGSSPMMLSYAAAQTAAPDHVVLYRVGEFYEVLGRDALTLSRALGLQLTRRRQQDADDVPMCGIPSAGSAQAITRLLSAGHKVAISEQPERPGLERPLRQMTPATSVDSAVIQDRQTNNLTVALAADQLVAFGWVDLSTGEAGVTTASLEGCGAALARIGPAEVLVMQWPSSSVALAIAVRSCGVPFSDRSSSRQSEPETVLSQAYGEGWRDRLRGFSEAEVAALARLYEYVLATVGQLPMRLPTPRRILVSDTVLVDAPTLRGLEVLSSGSGRDASLLSVIDRTVSAAGARLLARQLAGPLSSPQQIGRRLAMVRYLVGNSSVRADCREDLSAMPDMLRACGRLSIGKGSPRDLTMVRDGLENAAALTARLQGAGELPQGLASAARELAAAANGACATAVHELRRGLVKQVLAKTSDGGYVAAGYDARLDKARLAMGRAEEEIGELQARYAKETGVKALRLRTSTLIGYHVEVPSAQAKSLGETFTLRQGLASSTRFSTAELDTLAAQLEEACEGARTAEQAVFTQMSNTVLEAREALTRVAHAAAALDLVAGLAQAAAEGLWTEPQLVDENILDIRRGRHPVAERILEAKGRSFVENDCAMGNGARLWLLTGPNMAGKSTFLRQVALIVLMAQIGSFVPAAHARIGVVDKLFSRIGASDDLASGRSTFFVEMLETAAILNEATKRSLVILDEVGRGTSAQEGQAIAQASMEHLHDVIACRTLFATHFHELADSAEGMDHAACMAMDASAGHHGDVFSFKVARGRAGHSYGLRTAALAGLPPVVLARAEALLKVEAKPDLPTA